MENQFNQNPTRQAAGPCNATCKQCKGNCSLTAQHGGTHQCSSGHNWAE